MEFSLQKYRPRANILKKALLNEGPLVHKVQNRCVKNGKSGDFDGHQKTHFIVFLLFRDVIKLLWKVKNNEFGQKVEDLLENWVKKFHRSQDR